LKPLQILLVDDHEVVRMGLRMLLERQTDVTVVGEAGTAREAIDLCEKVQPNLVIMDIRMPGGSGIDACRAISERWPEIQVIMLTSYADDELISSAIQAGAVGYILKDIDMQGLLRALDAARQGEASLDPAVTRRVLAMMREQKQPPHDPFSDLTDREVEVLKMVSEGKSNTLIAEALVVSDKTVRNYISTILTKLSTSNRIEAATFAVQNHIRDYRRAR
jgi:two-component system, NarL family, response regulator DevR